MDVQVDAEIRQQTQTKAVPELNDFCSILQDLYTCMYAIC